MLYFRGQQVKDVNDYCRCQRSGSITSEEEEWGYWDVCCDCGKPLENGFHYYNHYDGEDHNEEDMW